MLNNEEEPEKSIQCVNMFVTTSGRHHLFMSVLSNKINKLKVKSLYEAKNYWKMKNPENRLWQLFFQSV